MISPRPLLRISAFGVLAFVVAGCGLMGEGEDETHEAVSGTVTLDGKPLDGAMIVFDAVHPADPLEMSAGQIEDGRFSIPKSRGPALGLHKVRISLIAAGQANPNAAPGEPSKVARETLPEKYNTETVLTAEIRADQPNELEFSLDAD